jgi:hypothetical protein
MIIKFFIVIGIWIDSSVEPKLMIAQFPQSCYPKLQQAHRDL